VIILQDHEYHDLLIIEVLQKVWYYFQFLFLGVRMMIERYVEKYRLMFLDLDLVLEK